MNEKDAKIAYISGDRRLRSLSWNHPLCAWENDTMDDATIAGNLNQTLRQASASVHFREHFNELGDTLVIEYHFTVLPEKIDLSRFLVGFDTLNNLYWTNHHSHSTLNAEGIIGARKVSVELSLRKEPE